MIEINLLPGARKKPARGPSIDVAALFAGVSGRVKDPVMLGSIAAAIVGIGALAFMYLSQSSAKAALEARTEQAQRDSAHYSALFNAQMSARAKRDTVLRQVNLIRTIDQDRYIWPHIMDEVSRALPAYTWVTLMEFAGTPQGSINNAALPPPPKPPADPSKAPPPKPLPTEIAQDSISVRLTGRTVDIQTVPRFMRMLEGSPFLARVLLNQSDLITDPTAKQDVTQFELVFRFSRPDTAQLRRIPFVVRLK